jgi:transposase
VARPSKYTPETVKKITDAIKLGATYELACGYAGITFETFNQWRKAKPEFSEAVKSAEGAAAVGWLARIEKAANDGTWQAAAWKLERRYPEQYGRQVHDHYRRDVVERIAREEGVDPTRLYDLAFEREKRRVS